ncbi:MAG: ATP synthase F1 subunit epsilon [Oscillospiraceae bacterium]|jgi:F-type H+-transporting ATPase subunit epsilon|nr:ATP synthase F1 subunit epsilon [Oscillospiraceae bacterium]
MADFPLKIITPIKTVYNDRAKSVLMRTTEGDVCILANHENYVAPLSIGLLKFETADGTVRFGASSYGFVNVSGGQVCAFVMTFEFAEDIDIVRAKNSMEEARLAIAEGLIQGDELKEAKARYERCKSRIEVTKLIKK